eukprot:gene3612-3876_t
MLLQSLQLLQSLGLRQPGSSFMASFFAAADVLLDTLSGCNCLELLSAAASAGHMPPPQLAASILQHLTPLKLTAEEAALGMRLLASLRVRPSPELLAKWFAVTEAAADVLKPHLTLQILMWNVPANQPWKAALALHAAEVVPQGDGPSVIRLGMYLAKLFAADGDSEQVELPWQVVLRDSVARLLSSSSSVEGEKDLQLLLSADSNIPKGVGISRGVPAYALVLLYTGIMHHQPFIDQELQQLLVEAMKTAMAQEQLTMWDVWVALTAIEELRMTLAQEDMNGQNRMDQLLLLQQMGFLHMDAEKFIWSACRLRATAPAVVIQQLPVVASTLGLKIPSEVQQQLNEALAVAQAREDQLGKALMVWASGGAAIPRALAEQLDDFGAAEGVEALEHYLHNPLMAMMMSRWRRVGADVNDAWVLEALRLQ